MRIKAVGIVIAIFGVLSSWGAKAQDYPSRLIKVVVGPGPDIVGRLFGAKITEVLRQQVVIEPRPGAGGTIAAQTVAAAAPDGYTLLLASASYTINSALGQSPLDLGRDFAAVGLVVTAPFALVVHPSVPAKTLAELIAHAKANPGKLTYASSGIGTPPHLAGELFKSMAHVDIRHVPYRGAAPVITDLLGGRISMFFGNITAVLPQVQDGKLRALFAGIGIHGFQSDPGLFPGLCDAL